MHRILGCLILLSILSSCTGKPGDGTNLAPAIPYLTAIPSKTPTLVPPDTVIILPTPTTFTHTVVQGDTLIAIAKRYEVSLEALLAANPGIQQAVLSVGTILTIPTGDGNPAVPTPTPAPLLVQQARCWSETAGGLWCFALVRNDYADTIENLSAQFNLLDINGNVISTQSAFALLNVLPPGHSMPLAVHIPAPVQGNLSVRVQVLTSNRLLPGDTRYSPVELENTLVSVNASGLNAQLTGRVRSTNLGTANTLWVLATAFDSVGNVVGMRRWESHSALKDDTPVSFDFFVYSVGPAIDRVEFLAEARP
jgi:LysM repeat protein